MVAYLTSSLTGCESAQRKVEFNEGQSPEARGPGEQRR